MKAQRVWEKDRWSLAGELGFEPRQTESESVVLPLHHSPIIAQRYQYDKMSSGDWLPPDSCKSGELAPFYSLPPALGKRARMALLQAEPANPPGIFGAAGPRGRA